jgi:hypothetical protein
MPSSRWIRGRSRCECAHTCTDSYVPLGTIDGPSPFSPSPPFAALARCDDRCGRQRPDRAGARAHLRHPVCAIPCRSERCHAVPFRRGAHETARYSASRATPLPLPLPPPFHSTPLPRHRHATATATEMRRGAPRHDTQLSAGIAERKSGKAMRTPVCASNLCCAPCEWHSAHRAHAAVTSPALWCCMDCTWDPSHCCSGARCCNMSHCFATWRLTVLQRGGYCVAQLLPL